jgi:hypothetical protein
MNVQDIVRFTFLLCLIFSAGSKSAMAQNGEAVDASASLTLEQLKTQGALRSRYRQERQSVSSVEEDPS